MQLKDTIALMQSDDYKDRFKAEYCQVKIRRDRLHATLVKYESGTLEFKPYCTIDVLKKQESTMSEYLYWLEVRAKIENINLDSIQ